MLAGLNPSEIRDIVPVIRALSARGIAVLMIEHVMQAVMSLAEHVFVLAEGRIIAQGSPAQVAADPVVVEAYLGHGAAAKVGSAHVLETMSTEPLLDIRALCAGYGDTTCLRGIDLERRAGRDRRGAGLERRRQDDAQSHDVRHRARAQRRDPDSTASQSSARSRPRSSRAGLFTCRRAAAFSRTCRCAKISTSAAIAAPPRAARANRDRVFAIFPRLFERRAQRAGTLSGGEQQMLAIGRGLMAEPRLLILDEPSLGLSPLLVEEMFALIARIHADGVAVLLVEQNVVQSLEIAEPRLHPCRRAMRHVRAPPISAPIRSSNAPIWDSEHGIDA